MNREMILTWRPACTLLLLQSSPLSDEIWGSYGSEDVAGVFWVVVLQPWRWKQYVPPKQWYPPTSRHGVTAQKTTIDIFE
jgi:hypothetical protein